ncbi:anti-sigma factor domain-containing protein [Paenibacillus sp. DYY-L-2]|uniref:anti-sigma factor domain-containing protein n=1 Tax=Paenibacillus sp. DYY-L-2 TaxID=3447013 RepID=UPI003F508FCB
MGKSDYRGDLQGAGESDYCARSYTEEKWVDWLLGAVPEPQRADMAVHLAECPCCRRVRNDWEGILGIGADPEESADTFPPSSSSYAAERESSAVNAAPSDRVRRRLRRRVRLTGLFRSVQESFAGRAKIGAVLACVFLLLAGVGIFVQKDNRDDPWSRYVQRYEPEALSVMMSPESIAFPLDEGRMEPGSGMVWYNEDSREMLMLVGGLIPREDQVVQVWAVKEGDRDSLGLLQYHAYRAHLYVKDKDALPLQEADNLVLTIEPKNGNPIAGPWLDTISVDLSGRLE